MTDQQRINTLQLVDQALEEVRPHLAVDGGNIEVIEITPEGVARIRWIGSCEHCTMSTMTMKAGVEQAVLGKVSGVTAIEAVNGVGIE